MKKLLVALVVLGAAQSVAMDRPIDFGFTISSSGESSQAQDSRAKELKDAIYSSNLEEVQNLINSRTYSVKELSDAYDYSKSPQLSATAGEDDRKISELLKTKMTEKLEENAPRIDPHLRRLL